jgi:hypothetical protein
MNPIHIALSGLLLTSNLLAQTIPIPNPSFEQGQNQPDAWKLIGPQGQWLTDNAPDGRRAIAVSGDGDTSSFWQSPPLPLKPSTIYRLTFRARSLGASGGTATSGPAFCNRDLGSLPAQWTAYESIFVTPQSFNNTSLRFGQWHVNGAVAFDDITLTEVQPVYFHDADLSFARNEIPLGNGEMIRGSEYTFTAPFQALSANHSRSLISYNCGFNTDRWTFSPNTQAIYRHDLHVRTQMSAQVHVSVTWHNAGQLHVEASADGTDWKLLGTIDKLAAQSFKIPGALLPAREIFIRLRAGDDPNTSLQVGGYSYTSTLGQQDPPLVGNTHFFSISSIDPRLAVTIHSLGETVPGGYNLLAVFATNKTNQPITLTPTLAVESSRQSATIKPSLPNPADNKPWVIQPGNRAIYFDYELPQSGAHTLRLTLGDFTAETTLTVPDLHDTSYGQLLPPTTADTALWWASSGWKISDTRPAPTAQSPSILIRTARNEAEAAQLVLRPRKDLFKFTVQPQPLTGPDNAVLPADAIDILRVGYLMVSRPTDRIGAVGYWPDPLPPLTSPIKLEHNYNHALWIRVKVPRDAKPGLYTGHILLAADNYRAQVPLTVEVYDFALPDRMTCQTAFGFSPQNVWKYQKLDNKSDRRAVLEKYWANFAAHHISPYDPAPLDPLIVSWHDRKTFVPTFNFVAWDAAMTRAIDHYYFNTFRLQIPGRGGGTFHARVDPELNGFKENTPEYKAAFTNYGQAIQEHLRQKGWLDEAFVYWFDEPDPKDYAFVNNGFRKLKEAAPDLNRMLTEQVEPELVGGPNIWCPVTPEYRPEPAEQRRQAGDKFWWYVCTGPKAPYCTLFIDHPATEMRVWLWQTWQHNIDGILVWQTNYWTSDTAYPDPNEPQNPYNDPMGWVSGYGTPKGARNPWGNGDGRFIYPPEAAADASSNTPILDGPVDSIRWEMLRDGIEDYEYLTILRRLLKERGDKLPPAQRAACTALLQVPPDITSTMTTFTRDPAPIEARRHAIAKAIEALGKP